MSDFTNEQSTNEHNTHGELTFTQPATSASREIFTAEAVAFLTTLAQHFASDLEPLLAQRDEAQAAYDSGELPDFDPATKDIRDGDWKVAPIPKDLQKRRLEITGPVDRKMVINALNADVDVFMADFEDAQSPTWDGLVEG
ncbi:MAG: malate synthase A, partial [Idiomarina sp.]|nr:malate synthase A [Idiomarina sp.]